MGPDQVNRPGMPDSWERIATSSDEEELRSLARVAPPRHLGQERSFIVSNPHTPPDVLLSLVEEEQIVLAGDVSGMPDVNYLLSLDVVRAVAENPRAPTEALRKCVELAGAADAYTFRAALAHDNMPQEEVEERMSHSTGKGAYPWDGIFEKRGDHRSMLIAKLLRAGHDPANVVQEVEAILGG